ncbi:MAG TPA: hypothetical protein VF720_01005, partial [Candidatus Eisenbacteria bacterium]
MNRIGRLLFPASSLLLGVALATPAGALPPFLVESADPSSGFVGQYSSIVLDALGEPHVSYYDESNGNLKYAWKSGATWSSETADPSADIVGLFTSIALDAQGVPHVSYYDATNGDLWYANRSGGTWTQEVVDG